MKTKNKNKIRAGGVAGVVAGVAALGAGAYYLMGPKAKVHQREAKALMVKMQKEVMREMKKAKKLSVPLYHKAVDAVSKKYSQEYKAHEKEIKSFAREMKTDLKKVGKMAQKSVRVLKKKVA